MNSGFRHRSREPMRHATDRFLNSTESDSVNLTTCTDSDSSNINSDNDTDINISHSNSFMYLPVNFKGVEVAALLDTGCCINVMSENLYNTLPQSCKTALDHSNALRVQLADSKEVNVLGTSSVKACTPQGSCKFHVYVLPHTSNPLILGTEFMHNHKFVLDFDKKCYGTRKLKLRCKTDLQVQPNSECIVQGKLPKGCAIGLQGVCVASKYALKSGLLVARSVVTVHHSRYVPLKILNPGNTVISVYKGAVLADLDQMDDSYRVHVSNTNGGTNLSCNNIVDMNVENVNHVNEVSKQNVDVTCSKGDNSYTKSQSIPSNVDNSFKEFVSYFDFNVDNLSPSQIEQLQQCLYEYKDIFVTKQNPSLGFTTVVEHKIHLKPDVVSKHHKPYRLSPDKREVLRTQLTELLNQGIIAPVSETEDIPISSPIVLVSKRKKPSSACDNTDSKESHLASYRFCCDFRYLNSQTQPFRYTIPNLQELTESFDVCSPNFITSIDLSSGFFRWVFPRNQLNTPRSIPASGRTNLHVYPWV